MTHETGCRECTEDITITFNVEPGEPMTRMYPGCAPSVEVLSIEADCDCVQDEEGYDDELFEAADHAHEDDMAARADAAMDRRDDR